VHASIVDRVIFPIHERLKGKPTYARLHDLERSQWLEPVALRELQFRAVRAHLDFAYAEVPYYTRLLDEHELPPRRIQSFEDFSRIPYLTRDLLRAHFEDLQPRRRIRGTRRLSTGGSTGVPVTVLVDPERAAFTDAVRLRSHRWYKAGMGAREIVLWGSPIEVSKQDIVRAVRDRLLNSRLLSAFDLGEGALRHYAEIIRRWRPEKLYGYASALALLARYLEGQGWQPPSPGVRVVFATAEPLYDFQRSVIQSVFRCPAAVEYGCRDAGLVAIECPLGGLHIGVEGMTVEVLHGLDGSGSERGELVLTNPYSYAMPIIRYRTGDIGSLEPTRCACGRGLPLLRSVEGRRTDFLVTADGKVMHALAAIYILREVPGIHEFQLVQERLDLLRVLVVPEAGLAADAADHIVRRLGGLFGGGTSIEVELLDALPRLGSGKHRYVVSKVADQYIETLLAR
jgi:phenylacetate-CoA ligase